MKIFNFTLPVILTSGLLTLAGCGEETTSNSAIKADTSSALSLEGTPTYTKDIKPIMDKKCLMCHTATSKNGDYSTYKATVEKIDGVKKTVVERKDPEMPPTTGSIKITITDEQRALFAKWIEGNTPE